MDITNAALVYSNSPDTNYGNDSYLRTQYYANYDDWEFWEYWSYIEIPYTESNTTLYIYKNDGVYTTSHVYSTSSFNEYDITFNNRPAPVTYIGEIMQNDGWKAINISAGTRYIVLCPVDYWNLPARYYSDDAESYRPYIELGDIPPVPYGNITTNKLIYNISEPIQVSWGNANTSAFINLFYYHNNISEVYDYYASPNANGDITFPVRTEWNVVNGSYGFVLYTKQYTSLYDYTWVDIGHANISINGSLPPGIIPTPPFPPMPSNTTGNFTGNNATSNASGWGNTINGVSGYIITISTGIGTITNTTNNISGQLNNVNQTQSRTILLPAFTYSLPAIPTDIKLLFLYVMILVGVLLIIDR